MGFAVHDLPPSLIASIPLFSSPASAKREVRLSRQTPLAALTFFFFLIVLFQIPIENFWRTAILYSKMKNDLVSLLISRKSNASKNNAAGGVGIALHLLSPPPCAERCRDAPAGRGHSPWMHQLAGRPAMAAKHTGPANKLPGSALWEGPTSLLQHSFKQKMALHLALVLTGLKLRGNSGGAQSERRTRILPRRRQGW